MALRFAFILLFSIAAFGLGNAVPTQKCGANAEFRKCGSACEPTCAKRNPGPVCTLQCVIGCFCKEGFLMNSAGECVPPTECDAAPAVQPAVEMLHRDRRPPRCGVNEEFKECKGCDDTCFNRDMPCPRICLPGCACKEGHVRSEDMNGQCIPVHQCPIIDPPVMIEVTAAVDPVDGKCAANEVMDKCGSACAPTCQNPTPSPICTKQCVIGCFCQEGYLRNRLGMCVPSHQCQASVEPVAMKMPEPIQCPANEVFHSCGSACAPTCKNPTPSGMCTKQCVIGCFCQEGFLRNHLGTCVPTKECAVEPVAMKMPEPIQCPANEVFHSCGSACAPTCKNPHPSPVCTKQCVIGCFCQEGFLRNHLGTCVPTNDCPVEPVAAMTVETEKCGENEEFLTCGSFCPPTCANRNPFRCTLRCKVGCFCKKGFLKNAQGVCVPETKCEQEATVATPVEISAPIQKCPTENEIYHECGTQLNCLSSCTFKHTPECMQRMCTPGCVCKKPFVRHDDGRCVETKECPNKSPFVPEH